MNCQYKNFYFKQVKQFTYKNKSKIIKEKNFVNRENNFN